MAGSAYFCKRAFPAAMPEPFDAETTMCSCGPPVIGEVLADCCEELTARAKDEGYGMRFIMQIEVFG